MSRKSKVDNLFAELSALDAGGKAVGKRKALGLSVLYEILYVFPSRFPEKVSSPPFLPQYVSLFGSELSSKIRAVFAKTERVSALGNVFFHAEKKQARLLRRHM